MKALHFLIFWEKGDTINLSSEFENGVHTYLLKQNQNKDLVISSIPHTKDSLLFGLNLKEIILKQEANSPPTLY